MMSGIDWIAVGLGILAGTAAGAAYFAGLAWGVQLALRSARPAAVLVPSAALRIALLLAAGWWTAFLGTSALVGFALAFLALRLVLVATVRPKSVKGGEQWN
ncbi:ATP synthase subunit I [Roseovarius sp. Pro17]|uniref:N-ATPase subunit AtpR n=1 Tax=Roseovarius sp. Pro17 TaxID=3108175 RepID=UPI002D796C6B|nr:ATP synthase subunit I [Roseovarius sp. Pro17]